MLTDIVKMATGLVARGGLGLPLRIAALAAMVWAARRVWLAYGVPCLAWGEDHRVLLGGGGGILVLVVVVIVTLIYAASDDKSWRLWDFLRRAPFACWCLVTDDGADVPVWSLLIWPAIAVVDLALAAGTLIAMPCLGLWLVASAIGRLAWRILSIRPLGRGGKWR